MPDALDLTGRTAVITGASRGIGAAIAEALAQHGAALILNGRSESAALLELASRLQAEFAVRVACVAGDVGDPATASALAKRAFADTRRLDIWVNNAGALLNGAIGMIPAQALKESVDVNLFGVVHGLQAASRLMARSGGGSIINLTSIMGVAGAPGVLGYAAAKAGVIGATRAAAKELAAAGIRVNALAPGFIETDMTTGLSVAIVQERIGSVAMGRAGTPQDVANVALFLASSLSSYVTGQVIGVDGGMVI